MIVFRGKMSDECRKYAIWQRQKGGLIVSAVLAGVFLVPVALAGIFWDPLAFLFVVPLVLLPWLNLLPPSQKDEGLFLPAQIVIDTDEGTLAWESDKAHFFQYIEAVEEVCDMDAWYEIRFRRAVKTPPFICEKRLLCQGTEEDFEALFAEMLVSAEEE